MSVVVAENDRDPSEILVGHDGYAVVALTVGELEELGQGVVRDPQPVEPDHALVRGPKTKAVRREMARRARWIVGPPA
ncbi:MAG: hypothetical protein ACRDYZ_10225 [Acidimicrobiales bacterium]